MADDEAEKWALKSKQIEAERLKAARELENTKPGKENLAFFDPKNTKVKGWSNDPDVILANTERMGNRALVLAVTGVVLALIGYAGAIVASTSKLGAAGAIISSLPSYIGYACLFVAVLLGLIVVGRELYIKMKFQKKLTSSFWTGLSALVVTVVYFVVRGLV